MEFRGGVLHNYVRKYNVFGKNEKTITKEP